MVKKRLIRFIMALSSICCLATQSISATGSDTSSSIDVSATPVYVGTKVCLSCHEDKASFLETGHNFKVTKVVEGKTEKRPFTNIEGALEILEKVENSAGHPNSMEDVSYVIGGYRRAVMFVDKNGFVMTGRKSIINLPAEGEPFTPELGVTWYEGKGPDSLAFTYCGRCHTTGWKDYTSLEGDTRNRHRQDNMPGISGTWNQEGIQCESCHGAGGEHVKAATKVNITKVASGRTSFDFRAEDQGYGKPVACSECHSKDGERGYPTGYPDYITHYNKQFGGESLGGRTKPYPWGARLAKDGLMGVDPDTGIAMGKKRDFACTTCHDPHLSTHNRDKLGHEKALVKECTDCHYVQFSSVGDDNSASEGHRSEATCIDCHMPKQYHLMRINLASASDNPEHYSEDKHFFKPWLTAKMSCNGCHDDYDEMAAKIKKIHK